MIISRFDKSLLGIWWWTVDRFALVGFIALAVVGMITAVMIAPEEGINSTSGVNLMVIKQVVLLCCAIPLMIGLSTLSITATRRLGIIVFVCAFLLVLATYLVGVEFKGSTRWLRIPGLISFQPSELLKPGFALVIAWLLTSAIKSNESNQKLFDYWPVFLLYGVTILPVLFQPDVGQTLVLTATFAVQIFLHGFPLLLFAGFAALILLALVGMYFTFDHVRARIDSFVDRFFDQDTGLMTQADESIRAIVAGGFFGRGPGEGVYKNLIADSYSDFIFAAIAEEVGIIGCVLLLGLILFILFRVMRSVISLETSFAQIAACGLLAQFTLQILINVATATELIPTKGMTFPFLSFGGTSVLAVALSLGLILALTRKIRAV